MNKRNVFLGIIIVAAVGAAGYWWFSSRTLPTPAGDGNAVACTMDAKQCPDGSYVGRQGPDCAFAPCPAGISAKNWKDATYLIEGSTVTLSNGKHSEAAAHDSASTIDTTYFGNEATGDLNSDGKDDVAFLLTQSTGGSGTFYYVVAALKTDAGYTGTNAVLLGDRIAPQTTQIKDGKLVVNYADRAATDPMTAKPSVGVTKYLHVVDGALTEILNK